MTEATVRLERYLGNPSPERELPSRVGERGERLERSVQTIYEWFEWGFRPPPHTNRQREQDVMRRLPERGIVLILGVPGAGKSTLARQWFERLQTEDARPALIGECGLLGTLEEKENMLHAILGRGRNGKARDLLEGSIPPRTVLIVDALDELPTRFDKTKLISAIREESEHALVVLTCRTHVWGDTLEAAFKREQIRIDQTFTLLGFTPLEQREYLTRWAEQTGKPKQDAENLAKNLEKHPQLRSLAANALLLELIARVALEDGVMLPTSRAEFYERAIDNLWKHAELKGMIAKRNDLWRLRDRFLRALGLSTKRDDRIEARIGADEINEAMRLAAVPENLQDDLYDYLEKIGLLVKIGDPTSSELRFVHLTFHEFALAQGLILGTDTKLPNAEEITQKLENLLLKDWAVTAFEPTLALAISIAHGKKADLLRPFSSLVNSWRDGKPSALMAALHLYNNAAVESEAVTNMLVERIQRTRLGELKVSRDTESHPSVLEKLVKTENELVLWSLARNPNLPPSVLEKLVNSKNESVLKDVASHPNSPLSVLEKLVNSENEEVLWSLARNPSLPLSVLEKLVNSKNEGVLQNLARNPNLPPSVLEKLVNSEDTWVLQNLAGNPNLPPSVLEKLMNSESMSVLAGLAGNPNSPPSVLEKLINSEIDYVLEDLAGNPNSPPSVLEKLLNSESKSVLQNLALNPYLPPSVLEKLMNSKDENLLESLALNPYLPPSVLEKLVNSDDEFMLWNLALNPNFILEWISPPPRVPDSQSSQENTKPPPERNSMTWTKELTELRNVLMALYPTFQDGLVMVQDAGLNPAHVDLTGKAINFWHNILEEANKQEAIQEVINVAQARFSRNKALEAAVLEWQKHNGVPKQETPDSTRALYRKPEDTSGAGGSVSLEKPRWNPVNDTPEGVISVLFLPYNLSDTARLPLLKEASEVREQLQNAQYRNRFVFETREHVTTETVSRALLEVNPMIVHFAGHGNHDGTLRFVSENDTSLSVQLEALAAMIGRVGSVQCVVLNACYLARAASVVLPHVPYVIATPAALHDDVAIAFAVGFYQALGNGRDVGFAFNWGLNRIAVDLQGLSGMAHPELLERE